MLVAAEEILKAVEALLSYDKKSATDSLNILESKQPIILQITFKHIPKLRSKLVKIQLPSSLLTESSDVCLFVKDESQKTKEIDSSILHYKELFEKHHISTISEIIPLKKLKNEFKPFEAKRKLSNSFSAFLADERIVRLLPPLLGKNFYGRSRYPIQVNLKSINLNEEICKALRTTVCNMSTKGASFHVTAAHTEMKSADAAQNVLASLAKLIEVVPGGANNVRSIYLKTDRSPALPLFLSEDYSARSIDIPNNKKKVIEDAEEVATVGGGKVLVTASGKVKIIADSNFLSQNGQSKMQRKRKQPTRK